MKKTSPASMDVGQLRNYLLDLNKNVSRDFCARIGERRAWRKVHPTEFVIIQCMDGRVNLLKLCGVSLGLATIFENIGGKFELTWSSFLDALWAIEAYARQSGSPVCLIITYHWSQSDQHLGCAGFNYDTEAAKKYAIEMKKQCDYIFQGLVESVVIGIETDGWSLRIEGNGADDNLSTSSFVGDPGREEEVCRAFIAALEVFKNQQIVRDLSTIIVGNIKKIQRRNHRIIPLRHAERIICVGPHFDWLTRNTHNLCFSVSGHDPKTDFAVSRAATLVKDNIEQGTTAGGGIIFSCFPYRRSYQQRGADLLARAYADMTRSEIQKIGLGQLFKFMVGSIDMDTRQVELVKF